MRFVSVRRLLPVPAGLTGQGAWLVQIHPPAALAAGLRGGSAARRL